MLCEMRQHVIEETHPGADIALPGAVQIQFNFDSVLVRISLNASSSGQIRLHNNLFVQANPDRISVRVEALSIGDLSHYRCDFTQRTFSISEQSGFLYKIIHT